MTVQGHEFEVSWTWLIAQGGNPLDSEENRSQFGSRVTPLSLLTAIPTQFPGTAADASTTFTRQHTSVSCLFALPPC